MRQPAWTAAARPVLEYRLPAPVSQAHADARIAVVEEEMRSVSQKLGYAINSVESTSGRQRRDRMSYSSTCCMSVVRAARWRPSGDQRGLKRPFAPATGATSPVSRLRICTWSSRSSGSPRRTPPNTSERPSGLKLRSICSAAPAGRRSSLGPPSTATDRIREVLSGARELKAM